MLLKCYCWIYVKTQREDAGLRPLPPTDISPSQNGFSTTQPLCPSTQTSVPLSILLSDGCCHPHGTIPNPWQRKSGVLSCPPWPAGTWMQVPRGSRQNPTLWLPRWETQAICPWDSHTLHQSLGDYQSSVGFWVHYMLAPRQVFYEVSTCCGTQNLCRITWLWLRDKPYKQVHRLSGAR